MTYRLIIVGIVALGYFALSPASMALAAVCVSFGGVWAAAFMYCMVEGK